MFRIGLIVTVLLMWAGVSASAQDRIYFNDAAPVDAVVKEIGDDYVLYKMWDNQKGPDFRISLSRVDRIVYDNGTESVFNGSRAYGADLDALMLSGAVVPGRLCYRHGRYYVGVSVITPEQIRDYIGYKKFGDVYLKARNQYNIGLSFTLAGGAFLLVGVVTHIASNASDKMFSDPDFRGSDAALYGTAYGLGAAALAVGIPLMVTGNRKLNSIADEYNSRNGYGMNPAGKTRSLTMGQCKNGIGLAFNF